MPTLGVGDLDQLDDPAVAEAEYVGEARLVGAARVVQGPGLNAQGSRRVIDMQS